MSVNEVVAGLMWLEAVMTGDSTLMSLAPGGVNRGFAPPESAVPFIVMAHMSGVDTLTMNAVRLFNNPLFQVKAVGPASMTLAIAQAAAEIDALFKRASGSVAGGSIMACWRESPLLIDFIENGEQWVDIGGMYRGIVQQTS